MNGPRPIVLVVDDDDGVRECLALLLEERYDVLRTASGAEALATVERRAVDAMLLDVRMPDMDGIEVLRRLRASHVALPVVLLTAVDSVRIAVSAIKLGAADYLTKPFEDAELLTVLEHAIGWPSRACAAEGEVILWHGGGDLGRRAAVAALLGTIAGVHVAPGGGAVIDGGPDLAALRRQLGLAYPRLAVALEAFGALTTRVTELVAPSYRFVTVEELARLLRCSSRHLSRRFGQETHVTVREYLARVRTEAAKCLLLETTCAVEAIGDEVGFADGSHFRRVFRLYAGTSPGLYRQRRGMSEASRSGPIRSLSE